MRRVARVQNLQELPHSEPMTFQSAASPPGEQQQQHQWQSTPAVASQPVGHTQGFPFDTQQLFHGWERVEQSQQDHFQLLQSQALRQQKQNMFAGLCSQMGVMCIN
jgi:hypothetical protein